MKPFSSDILDAVYSALTARQIKNASERARLIQKSIVRHRGLLSTQSFPTTKDCECTSFGRSAVLASRAEVINSRRVSFAMDITSFGFGGSLALIR
mmetsp:Transcript_9372/g.18013  ORF Transcript_9372/g.18013 Transcript_9372/m.18013 type:complete len:96 (-) Transcript_9372:5182-5469(-)